MSAPVWVLSVDLQTKTATFQSGLSDAAKTARTAFTDIKSGSGEMGGTVRTNMFEARHSVMLLGDEFGVHLPRALTSFVAGLGPVGAALEAAFPFAAIAVGATLLIQHLVKMHEAGEKLTQDQMHFATAYNNAFNALDQKMLQAEIRADELKNDHMAALGHQIELIDKQSLGELAHQFEALGKIAEAALGDIKKSWFELGSGSAGTLKTLQSFQATYQSLLSSGDAQGATNLLHERIAREERVLALQKQVKDNEAAMTQDEWGSGGAGDELKYREATTELAKMGAKYDDDAMRSQQAILQALHNQVGVAQRINDTKSLDKGNATASTGKEMAAREVEAARQAAEHRAKMGELALAAEREQANVSLAIHQASIAERLASDIAFADKEHQNQLSANQGLIDALNHTSDDYLNQRKALNARVEEIDAQHNNTVAALQAKAREALYREDLQALEQSERAQIEATEQGSVARLAAIDNAIREEQARNLQATQHYRELLTARVEAARQAALEEAKLSAEAAREAAGNEEKTGEVALASQREFAQLAASLGRASHQEQLAQELAFAREDYKLKQAAMDQEIAGLDKGAKDYQNKLRELQDKEKQMGQAHYNELAAIRAKSDAKQMQDQRSAIAAMEQNFAQGFMQVLQGHQSFASIMEKSADQLTGNLVSAAIAMASHMNDDKLDTAKSAARQGFAWGTKYGGPAAPVLAPTMAAAFFAGVMAFEGGGIVPGTGHGDVVPAALTPGEGIIPNSMMDNLNQAAKSGSMGGTTHVVHLRPVYHLQALDAAGMERVLDKHGPALQKHVEKTIRKMNG